MRCASCGEVYPSEYYFHARGQTKPAICTVCHGTSAPAQSLAPGLLEEVDANPRPPGDPDKAWSIYGQVLMVIGATLVVTSPIIAPAAAMRGWRGVAFVAGAGALTFFKGLMSR